MLPNKYILPLICIFREWQRVLVIQLLECPIIERLLGKFTLILLNEIYNFMIYNCGIEN